MKPLTLADSLALRIARPGAEAEPSVPAEAWQREMEKAQASMWLGHDPVGTGARGEPGMSSRADRRDGSTPAGQQRGPRPERAAPAPRKDSNPFDGGAGAVAARAAPRIQLATGLLVAASPEQHAEAVPLPAAQQARQAIVSSVGAAVAKAASTAVEVFACNEPPRHLATPVGMAGRRDRPADDGEAPQAAPEVKASLAAPQDQADPEAVRVYCQFTADGLMVWIGAAANSGFNAQAVAAQLQQALARQSQRLAALTCNGRLVALPPDSFILPTHKEPTWPLEQ